MARGKASGKVLVQELAAEPKSKKRPAAKRPAKEDDPLDRVLDRVDTAPLGKALPAEAESPKAAKPAAAVPALRMARVLTVAKRAAEISFRGAREKQLAALAEEVETEVVAQAAASRSLVLVEVTEDAPPVIVGVLQTRIPRDLTIKAGTITLEAEREVLIRSGRSGLRLREDGDIEMVGSRIVTASRGLLRLVGRMLRLN